MYSQEDIKGLITCVGGGAKIENPKIEYTGTKIELHFHINGNSPNIIEQIKEAIVCVFKTTKGDSNENGETFSDLSTLLEGDKRPKVVE